MEFMNRGTRQAQPLNTGTPGVAHPAGHGSRKSNSGFMKGLRVASVALLFSATILIVVLVWYFVIAGPRSESNYVESDKYQAIFLNGGQVYFGKIKDLNSKYVRMTDIFYLRVNQVVQPKQGADNTANNNGISLVKLGCELHRPSNEMLINREQVVFWENLKEEDGENTVPGAVKKYLAQYPNGQECQEAAASSTTPASEDIKSDQ